MGTSEASRHAALRISANGILPSLGVVSSLAAIVTKACCILPLALAGAGAGASSLTIVQALMPFRVPALLVSALFIAGGWLSHFHEMNASRAACQCARTAGQQSRRNLMVLSGATALLAMALAWDRIQPLLLQVAT